MKTQADIDANNAAKHAANAATPEAQQEGGGVLGFAAEWVPGWSILESGYDGACAVGSTIASANPFAEEALGVVTGPSLPLSPERQAAATTATAQLMDAMGGWFDGTNEDAIRGALRGKSPDELAEIRRLYHERTGGYLENALRGELSGSSFDEAMAQLSGDPVTAAVASLDAATFGVGTREDVVNDVLSGLTRDQVRAVNDEWARTHGGQSLTDHLDGEEDGTDFSISAALANEDMTDQQRIARANAFRLDQAMNGGLLGIGSDDDTIYATLATAQSPEERAALETAYLQVTDETHWFGGETLRAGLDDEMDGAEQDLGLALVDGRHDLAGAARLQLATEGLGTNENSAFATLSSSGGQAAARAWEQLYGGGTRGSFLAMARGEFGDLDFERAHQLSENGRLDPAFALHYAMAGLGSRSDMLRETLRGKTREEIQEIAASFRQAGYGDLRAELTAQTGGRDEFDLLDQFDHGEARTLQERVARANRVHDHERGSAVSNFFIDALSDSGERLDRETAAINQLAAGGPSAALTQHLLNAEGDVASTRAAEDSIAGGASTLLSAGVTVATAGMASVPAAIISALGASGAGMGARVAIQGYDYIGTDAMTTDAISGLASAGAAGLVQGRFEGAGRLAEWLSDGAIAGASVTKGLQQGISGAVTGGVGAAASAGTYHGETGDALLSILRGTGLGGLQGALAGAATAQLGARLGSHGDPAAATGALSGAAGGLVQGLVSTDTLDLSWDDLMRRCAWNMVTGGAQGAVDAHRSTTGIPPEAAPSMRPEAGPSMPPDAAPSMPLDAAPLPVELPVWPAAPGAVDLDLPAPSAAPREAAPPWALGNDTVESLTALGMPDYEARNLAQLDAGAFGPTLSADQVQGRVQATFGTDAVTAPTAGMTVEQAAAQRTHEARDLLRRQGELGIAPGEEMDPRIVARAAEQQRLLEQVLRLRDQLGPDERLDVNNVMPPSALDVAEELSVNGGPTTIGDANAVRQRLAGLGYAPADIAGLPAEQQLLLAGYSPEEIVRHFTARDLDFDVAMDTSDPSAQLQARQEARTVDPLDPAGARMLPALSAGGDVNSDATTDGTALHPTVRRPITQDEASRAVGMNAVMRESFDLGGMFAKVIPSTTVGDYLTGLATRALGTPTIFGPAMGVRGDLGRAAQTELSADRSSAATSLDQMDTLGLDYPSAENQGYIVLDPSAYQGMRVAPEVASGRGLDRVVGSITPQMEESAAVPVGRGVMLEAQRQSLALAGAAGAGDHAPYVPRMLQRGGGGDEMPRLMERNRESPIDTRSGGGYSVTERLGHGVAPNQELTLSAPVSMPDDARVETTSPRGEREVIMIRVGDHMEEAPGAGAHHDYLEAQRHASEERIGQARARK